ncbi:DEAD/DEAH box helicase [Dokdonella sp.]|uniref:type I-G CRISPR-associated helicase/endonuclease Cas3g n=1 Tax=Dokdonella sp. TaxID=2291710 RepID=UPI0031C2278E|nr:DEAD/DEAH box helicase [Dokdonella sp.]
MEFSDFFQIATRGLVPYEWQCLVAKDGFPDTLRIPTGLGKTEAALAWAWRLFVDHKLEPRHLVVCLPMRSLVSQTVQRLQAYFRVLSETRPDFEIRVHQLMGGAIDDDWAGKPDKPWVLVGTQDQLLSRALNRGYAMSRFEWPVHFGLLNNDCRWLIDEVQLMGPGLWTTSQLDWMRRKRFPSLKPCLTTWMSATIDTSFLSTTDRVREALSEPSQQQVAFEGKIEAALDRDNGLDWWREAKRPLAWWQPDASAPKPGGGRKRRATKPVTVTPDVIAGSVKAKHVARTLTLVICNTVDMARAVFGALSSINHKVLLTSRFRREDRAQHEERLIDFDTKRKNGSLPKNDPGLICVSTQVVEAGVDISAHRLFTELAPWPSMLQRLGRLNRKGDDQDAQAWVWETPKEGGSKKRERIGPYEFTDIELAKKLVSAFAPLSQANAFSEAIAEVTRNKHKEVSAALQPKPSPLPRALVVHGLFSTERDVHGGFTDVSPFVRGTDPDLDVTVFWRDWSDDNPPRGDDLDGPLLEPAKEGCPVSFVHVQKMLESSKAKAWLWDDEADNWERLNHGDIRPGMLVMLKRDVGGYDAVEGWTGDRSNVLADAPRVGRGAALRDDTWTEAGYWSKLEDHLRDARGEAEKLCDALSLDGKTRAAVIEAAGLHDLGKAHPQWQAALPDRSGIPYALLAKSPRVVAVDVWGDASAARAEFVKLRPRAHALPDEARRRGREDVVRLRWAIEDRLSDAEVKSLRAVAGVRWAGHLQFRPGLRHEVASAVAMWRKYRDSEAKPYPALAVYLAATHHGKARTVMRSTTGEGDDVFGMRREPSVLVIGGDEWPLDFSIAKDGAEGRWEGDEFVMTGPGWTGLVADLLGPWRPEEMSDAGAVPEGEPRHLGPFALAYLEALVRVADWRASAQPSASKRPSAMCSAGNQSESLT